MKDLSETKVCVIDHGLFPHIALCLAEQCEQVFYTGPSEKVMRMFEDDVICDGFDNVKRVESVWQVDEICDVFVFPDTGFHWEQKKLLREGRPVFGHHGADVLELYKGNFLNTLADLEMPVPPHRIIEGMDPLMRFLFDTEEKWVKCKWRGDWETFHWRTYDLDSDYLRGHKYNRCPNRNNFRFYVFDKIDSKIEDGIDTWCIDGEWPKTVLHAMERKDKSLIGGMQLFSSIQEDVRGVNERFGPFLGKKFGYRGPFSTEVRLADEAYFIDPTCRFGSPPSQLQTKLITNLPEVICRGAYGELVEPEYDDPIGAQVLVTSDKEKEGYLTLPFPPELQENFKSAFCCEIDGIVRITPNPLENWAGWIVATGKTIKATIDRLKELKEMLPPGFDCDLSSLSDLLRELEEAKKQDITITDQPIPAPSEVVE